MHLEMDLDIKTADQPAFLSRLVPFIQKCTGNENVILKLTSQDFNEKITQEELEEKIKNIPLTEDTIDITTLNDNTLYELLGYEMWKDGLDWELVPEIVMGKNPLYKKREDCIQMLKMAFNY